MVQSLKNRLFEMSNNHEIHNYRLRFLRILASENYIKYKIIISEQCVICMLNKPTIIYECLHKSICDECFINFEHNMICTMCNLKSSYVIYLK